MQPHSHTRAISKLGVTARGVNADHMQSCMEDYCKSYLHEFRELNVLSVGSQLQQLLRQTFDVGPQILLQSPSKIPQSCCNAG